jgi:hypothetical protein
LLADVRRSKGKALRHAAENKSTTAAGYESLGSMCFFLICSINLKLGWQSLGIVSHDPVYALHLGLIGFSIKHFLLILLF